MQENHEAGGNIASYCTKCRLALDHTVVAMEGGRVARVTCRTCGGTHRFRDPSDAQKARKARATPADTAGPAVQWEAAIAEAKRKPLPYRMDAKYRVGDVVDHERFGQGIVQRLYANKCDVLFRDRERLMASGN